MEPPARLPEQGITEVQFNIWVEQLEVFLEQEPPYTAFLAIGPYSSWESHEDNPDRITRPAAPDTAKDLPTRRRELAALLSLVAKSVDERHIGLVTKQSTSLKYIYDRLREDYRIQQPGIALLSVIGLRYQPTSSAASFYHKVRDIVAAGLGRRGDQVGSVSDPEPSLSNNKR